MAIHIIEHPVLKHKLSILRDKNTTPGHFRAVLQEISALIAFEVSKNLSLKEKSIETPLKRTTGYFVNDNVVLVSIMRAGNGMIDGFLRTMPFAEVGHIGIYRDKFIHNTVEYYFRLPKETKNKKYFLVDPLLATADTAVAAINRLKSYDLTKIKFISILSSPQGVERLQKEHPDVDIYTLSIEEGLNEQGYILPGLGDAGDRIYGTFN